jgi:hypothetical protein
VIIALYIDDLVLTSNSSDLLSKVKAALKEDYKMTELGKLSWCLGIQVGLEKFGMQDCKPCKTPAAIHFKTD